MYVICFLEQCFLARTYSQHAMGEYQFFVNRSIGEEIFFAVGGRAVRQVLMGWMCDRPPPLAFGLPEKREERILSKKGRQNVWVGICGTFGLGLEKGRQNFFAAPLSKFLNTPLYSREAD
jgi:hypothetical protein